jgi:hypothetical protein
MRSLRDVKNRYVKIVSMGSRRSLYKWQTSKLDGRSAEWCNVKMQISCKIKEKSLKARPIWREICRGLDNAYTA